MSTPHNPANVNPELIPEGYRLITVEERQSFDQNHIIRPGLRMFINGAFGLETCHGNDSYSTYITPDVQQEHQPDKSSTNDSEPQPQWHDPRGVGDPGDGFRFLIREEVDGRYRYNESLCFYSPSQLIWKGYPNASGASVEDTYRIDAATPIPGYPNWKPKVIPIEDMTEDQAKLAILRLAKPTKDIVSAITIAPTNPTVRSFAYRAMMGVPGFAPPSDPPQTLAEWLVILRKVYAETTFTAAAAINLGAYVDAEDEIAFTVECRVDESGTAVRAVYLSRQVSSQIDIPVRVARQGTIAVEQYIRSNFGSWSEHGDVDSTDSEEYSDEDWDGYRARDIEWDEDLDDECEPYLETDDDDDDDDE